MRVVDILAKKRDGGSLSPAEIDQLVYGFTAGDVADYQMAAFLMAAYLNGMTPDETFYLTQAMVKSGDTVDLSAIQGIKVDKHSTGGVGDKVTLILAPMMAAVGLKVAKMSGRALGHTGGTLDKLGSIPGFNVNLTEQQFVDQVNNIGVAIIGQTKEICPADKKMYALRDVTATVPSIPLIASSVMCKKIAGGADVIVLDVKAGSGAFMKTVADAKRLAEELVAIGRKFGKKVVAVISNMDQPLGSTVGNSLEVEEAIDAMRDFGPADVLDLTVTLGSYLMVGAGAASSTKEAVGILSGALESGRVLQKFEQLIEVQGGDASVIENPRGVLPHARFVEDVEAMGDGYVHRINAEMIGKAAHILGAGREKLGDDIDYGAGIIITHKVGDFVHAGDPIAQMHSSDARKFNEAREIIQNAFQLGSTAYAVPSTICDIIT
ncbi:MAG TPA: thymidine phosphorylase [Candidatus Aquicultor sp.]|jgi:pyrimidine-nucleoside phosphorylase